MFRRHSLALSVLGVLLGLQGCGMDKTEIPGLFGPSELGLALKLQAIPDWLVADNQSQAQILGTLYGPNGQPVAGRAVVFELTDPTGVPAGIGELITTTGQQIASGQSATAVTNSSGVASVIMFAPARTDILSPTNVMVRARPVGSDFNAAIWQTVRVQIIPADPRLFPPKATNTPPLCGFVIQPLKTSYAPGEQILFQDASQDTDGFIARYEWQFGDGTSDNKSDVNHAYVLAGSYSVVHTVVDNNGAQTSCPAKVISVK